jgi:hypothetical protein
MFNFDPCVLPHTSEAFFNAIYVNNITLHGHGGTMMNTVKNTLKSEFEVTDLGDLHCVLGIQIKSVPKGIELWQTPYIVSILSRFGLQEYNLTIIPIDRVTPLRRTHSEYVLQDINPYQLMIGSIMYLVMVSRPDLTFAISLLAPFSSAPNKEYVAAIQCSLRYIKGIWHLTFLFPDSGKMFIARFSESDYVNWIDNRRSVSGYLFQIGNLPNFLVITDTKICDYIYYGTRICSPFKSCKALPLAEDYPKRPLISRNTNSPIL